MVDRLEQGRDEVDVGAGVDVALFWFGTMAAGLTAPVGPFVYRYGTVAQKATSVNQSDRFHFKSTYLYPRPPEDSRGSFSLESAHLRMKHIAMHSPFVNMQIAYE